MTILKTFKTISVLSVLACGLVSCDPNEPATPNSIEPGPVVQVNSYPLEIGNQWAYSMTTDITGGQTWNTEHTVTFEVISDTVINAESCKKVRSTETEGQNVGLGRLSHRYFSLSSNGLDVLAVEGPMTQVFFKLEDEVQLPNYSMVSFNSVSSDTIIVLDTSLHYMKLPSVDGESWLSNEFGAVSGANFTRRWSGYYTVTTDAGSFDCVRLDMFGDQDGNQEPDSASIYIQQYISPQYGLIKEIDTRDLNFEGGSTGELLRETTLVSVNF